MLLQELRKVSEMASFLWLLRNKMCSTNSMVNDWDRTGGVSGGHVDVVVSGDGDFYKNLLRWLSLDSRGEWKCKWVSELKK